jgi:ribokinase
MLTVLNPAPAPAESLPATLLRHVTVLTPNRTELATLTGTAVPTVVEAEVAARRLLEQGVGAVVVSLGGDGALLVDARGARHHRAYPVEPVDPTGAGDAFNAGLAVALLEGKELDEAVRFANACGALATTRVGAQPSLPRRGDVEALLAAGQT